jgi:branched-chain amino acid transport system ATP-binding protein
MSSNESPMKTPLLEAQDLNVSYGDAPALWDVSFTVAEGELVSIVGPNGAGKTTLVNTLARLQPVRSGKLLFRGEDATVLSARDMCNRDVALIPEGRKLFGGMTVEENLDMGCYRKAARPFREEGLATIYGMFPVLKERRWQAAGTLSGGQQQMVAIGRALMARPKMLLIDEPSLGLAPAVVQQVFEVIQDIHESGMSILLIEQNAARALAVAQRAYVLEGGRIVSTGLPADLMTQPHIREAYLGENAA